MFFSLKQITKCHYSVILFEKNFSHQVLFALNDLISLKRKLKKWKAEDESKNKLYVFDFFSEIFFI